MKYLFRSLLLVMVLFVSGCEDLDKPSNPVVDGGKLVVDFSPELMKKTLMSKGLVDKSRRVFGYKAYKIPYTTTDEEGNDVVVSGIMVIPTGLDDISKAVGLSMVSDDHGTIFANREAPGTYAEVIAGTPDGAPVILTSLAGFITLQPDYIGFGDSSDHYHPFVLKRSLANATIDFIEVAREFAKNNDIKLNGQLFLTGYSEGGYAALATLEKIEKEGGPQVIMALPMAGPYVMDGLAAEVLGAPTLTVPSFMANVGYAYARAYGKELSDVINEPYASNLETLFDGSLARPQIDPQLTTKTTGEDGLFNPALVKDFFGPDKVGNPDNWFMQAVSKNSVYKWAPQTPLKLIHCMGDTVIPFSISMGTAQAMNTIIGSEKVEVIPVEMAMKQVDPNFPDKLGHAECATYAYGIAAKIFSGARAAALQQAGAKK